MFFIWPIAVPRISTLRDYLGTTFNIVGEFKLEWTQDTAQRNMNRLYLNSPQQSDSKIRDVGYEGPHIFLVEDHNPRFRLETTNSREPLVVNARVAEAKKETRRLADVGYPYAIHSTQTEREFRLTWWLIFGLPFESSSDLLPLPRPLNNLVGASGWQSVADALVRLGSIDEYARMPWDDNSINGIGGEAAVVPPRVIEIVHPSPSRLAALMNADVTEELGYERFQWTLSCGDVVSAKVYSSRQGILDSLWESRILAQFANPQSRGEFIVQAAFWEFMLKLLQGPSGTSSMSAVSRQVVQPLLAWNAKSSSLGYRDEVTLLAGFMRSNGYSVNPLGLRKSRMKLADMYTLLRILPPGESREDALLVASLVRGFHLRRSLARYGA